MIEKILLRNDKMEQFLSEVPTWNIPDMEKNRILSFFKDYALGKITRRRPEKSTMEHYVIYIRKAFEFLGKSSEELTQADVDRYATALIDDTIKSKNKKPLPLSQSVKIKMMRTLSQYLKWAESESNSNNKQRAVSYIKWDVPINASILCKSLDVKVTVKSREPKFLTENEIDKLYKGCSSPERRYLIAVLFSSGARASEFCNIRRSDVTLPEGKDSYVKIKLQEVFSKTKGRTISLYYKNSIEAVSEFMQQRIKEGMKLDEPVWNTSIKGFSYNTTHKWLKYTGKKILDKPINFHMFRSSCATHLATKLNRQELCYFFGWKFSSPMADIYINREGIPMNEVDNKMAHTELGELQVKLQRTEHEHKMTNEKVIKLQELMQKILANPNMQLNSINAGDVVEIVDGKQVIASRDEYYLTEEVKG